MSRKAVFLDRDGTIIEDTHYPKDPALVKFCDHAVEGLLGMKRRGFLLFSLSNQSGVGRGLITKVQFEAVHQRFVDLLTHDGVLFDGFEYCLHAPEENCVCRKPKTGMVDTIMARFPDIDLKESIVIGDREADIRLGNTIGVYTCLVLTGKGRETLRQLVPHPKQEDMHVNLIADSLTSLAMSLSLR